MGSLALLQSLKESVLSQANVKAIYGEPVSAHDKTIIPVARIMYGYGAGAGTGGLGEKNTRGEGGGGGGGVRAVPVGVIEVSNQQTRFVPISDKRKVLGAALAGVGFGILWGWRRRHRSSPLHQNIGRPGQFDERVISPPNRGAYSWRTTESHFVFSPCSPLLWPILSTKLVGSTRRSTMVSASSPTRRATMSHCSRE